MVRLVLYLWLSSLNFKLGGKKFKKKICMEQKMMGIFSTENHAAV